MEDFIKCFVPFKRWYRVGHVIQYSRHVDITDSIEFKYVFNEPKSNHLCKRFQLSLYQ